MFLHKMIQDGSPWVSYRITGGPLYKPPQVAFFTPHNAFSTCDILTEATCGAGFQVGRSRSE